jgi:hypothetical protein
MDANNNVFFYKSCSELHRLYANNQLELERQLQIHREAATIHGGFQYCENPAEEGYRRLHPYLCFLNNVKHKQGNA